jgi:hypothetical protein
MDGTDRFSVPLEVVSAWFVAASATKHAEIAG